MISKTPTTPQVQALDRKSALQLLRECIKRFQHKTTMAQDMV